MSIGTPYKHHTGSGDFDSIVIGSGIGGLCSAALLSRLAGQRVLVLERHYTAGGFTHSFRRPGFEWDVGVHYIGQVSEPGDRLRRVFDALGDGSLQWADMGEVYDRIEIGDRCYDLVKGKQAFRARMKRYFPQQARAIDRYLTLVGRASRSATLLFAAKSLPGPLQRVLGPALRWPGLRYARRTTREVLGELTSDAELRGVLSAQFGDYGLPPSEASFMMHALVVDHYLSGAAYPVGGASRIAESILPTIEASGGQVLVRAEVREILIENDRAVGVRMADGRELRGRHVISDAGAAITVGQLLPAAARARVAALQQVTSSIGPSCAHVSLYVGLDRTASELGLSKANRWLYPGPDHDANVQAFLRDPEAPLPAIYLSFPSAKDPAFETKYPGRATIEVVSNVPYTWFERHQASQWGRREPDYLALKTRLEQRLRQILEQACPSVVGHIQHCELSTPLSTRHFTGHPHGEIYGIAHTPARFAATALQPRTPIAGLYLTGADVCTGGVAGALMGGIMTASVVLQRNVLAALRARPTPPTAAPARAS